MASFGTTNQTQYAQQHLGPISRLMTFRSAQGGGAWTPVNKPVPGASTGSPIRPIGPGITGPAGLSPTSPAASQFVATTTSPLASSVGGGGTGAFDSSSGGAMMTQPTDTTSSSALSSIPWYVWAAVALAAFFLLAQPRELHIKA